MGGNDNSGESSPGDPGNPVPDEDTSTPSH